MEHRQDRQYRQHSEKKDIVLHDVLRFIRVFTKVPSLTELARPRGKDAWHSDIIGSSPFHLRQIEKFVKNLVSLTSCKGIPFAKFQGTKIIQIKNMMNMRLWRIFFRSSASNMKRGFKACASQQLETSST